MKNVYEKCLNIMGYYNTKIIIRMKVVNKVNSKITVNEYFTNRLMHVGYPYRFWF